MDIQKVLTWLKQTLEGIATGSVLSLKQHIYKVSLDSNKVEVTNPPKIPTQMDVKVLNPTKDTIKEINQLKGELVKVLNEIKKQIKPVVIPSTVTVKNLKEAPKAPDTISVKNFPTETKVSNLKELVTAINQMGKMIDKLPTEYPKAPEKITVLNINEITTALTDLKKVVLKIKPASFTETDIRGKDAKAYVPVRLTDGEKFYEAIQEVVAGGGGRYAFSDSEGAKKQALVDKNRSSIVSAGERWNMNHSETSGDTTFVGSEDTDGNWLLTKVVKTGTVTAMTYATIRNNKTITSYNQAWEARLSLTFSTAGSAL